MRYIGNKDKLLSFIINTIINTIGNIQGKTVADLFCGTASVAKSLKTHGCKLITNDYMWFSYVLQMSYIHNNKKPCFYTLSKNMHLSSYSEILEYLNSLKDIRGFFYHEYTLEGSRNSKFQRNYFSEENAIRIDSIRVKLNEWHQNKLVTDDEFFFLLTSLIDAVTKVSNIAGTYGAFLKYDDKRKHKRLLLDPIIPIIGYSSHNCYCMDTMDIITKVKGDVLYLDPPYNIRLYPPNYHILDTVALYDNPIIYGKTGRRPYKDKLSPFCYKNQVSDAFMSLVSNANFEHIFISYSTDGLISENELYRLLKEIGKVYIFYEEHRRFKSNSFGDSNDTKANLKELLYYVRKQ